jgi:uncharacterized protein
MVSMIRHVCAAFASLGIALCVSFEAQAITPAGPGAPGVQSGKVPGVNAPLPGMNPQTGYIDDVPAGTVPWSILSKAKTVQKADKKLGPLFTQEIKELDTRELKLYGFMMPLDGGTTKQKRFLLTAWPPHCGFCMPGGPEMMVEVVADKSIEFTMEPIVVSGKFAVLENDVVYYRLTKAQLVKTQ